MIYAVFRMGLQHVNLLPGLLLAVDGSAVCGWRDESRMVGCVNRIHPLRKSRAVCNVSRRVSRVTGLLLIGAGLWVVAEAVLWF